MCYTTPGHPVQCAVQDHKRILPVFVKYPVRHLRSRIHPVVWLAPKYAMFLRTLRNPIYTGTYVFGRTRTVRCLDDSGVEHTRHVRVE